jgi:RNA polymerase sigma factor (sigma-70 family)
VNEASVEDLLREVAPQVLGALVRRYGHFDAAEDAVQEALLAAALQWPGEGVPDNPRGWLVRVASRRMIDHLRAEQSRRRREDEAGVRISSDEYLEPAADQDDTLILLFMCAHPALTAASQIPLILRAVGGLTTEEIAHAFLVPEATMAKRITRAKQRIKTSGVPFRMPPENSRADRLGAVLHVPYLIFNEGYAATSGTESQRGELTGEAIRLTRMVRRLLPADGEVAGLLALMLLADARSPARIGPAGEITDGHPEPGGRVGDGARTRGRA